MVDWVIDAVINFWAIALMWGKIREMNKSETNNPCEKLWNKKDGGGVGPKTVIGGESCLFSKRRIVKTIGIPTINYVYTWPIAVKKNENECFFHMVAVPVSSTFGPSSFPFLLVSSDTARFTGGVMPKAFVHSWTSLFRTFLSVSSWSFGRPAL